MIARLRRLLVAGVNADRVYPAKELTMARSSTPAERPAPATSHTPTLPFRKPITSGPAPRPFQATDVRVLNHHPERKCCPCCQAFAPGSCPTPDAHTTACPVIGHEPSRCP